jgi:HEAT repeat protein
MNMNVEKWREGIGFDLAALEKVTDSERETLLKMLVERLESEGDWREIEALAAIGTPQAKAALRRAAEDGSPETRLYAAEQLARLKEPTDLERAIIEALRKTSLFGGLSQALDLAEDHPSPRIQETLLDLALNGDEEQRIHCAALALYLGGKAEEAFDWNHRPFFLQFGDDDRKVQIKAYKELCSRLGVPPRV